jgi:hypothetical protein
MWCGVSATGTQFFLFDPSVGMSREKRHWLVSRRNIVSVCTWRMN